MLAMATEENTAKRSKINILVAVDGSDQSMRALRWTIDNLLKRNNSTDIAGGHEKFRVTVLYAQSSTMAYVGMDSFGGCLSYASLVETLESCQRTATEGVLGTVKLICEDENVSVETKVMVGDPRQVICEAVTKLGADLLVIGSHGYGVLKRALLGSVSDYCAHNADCPVLIVKQPTKLENNESAQ